MTLREMVEMCLGILDDVSSVGWTTQEVVDALTVELQAYLLEALNRRDERAVAPYVRALEVTEGDTVDYVLAPLALQVVTEEDSPARWITAHYVPWHLWTTYVPVQLPYPRICRWTLRPTTTAVAPGSPGRGLSYQVHWDVIRPEWNRGLFYYVEGQPSLREYLANWDGYSPPLPREYHFTIVYRCIKRLITEYQQVEGQRYQLPEWMEPRQAKDNAGV